MNIEYNHIIGFNEIVEQGSHRDNFSILEGKNAFDDNKVPSVIAVPASPRRLSDLYILMTADDKRYLTHTRYRIYASVNRVRIGSDSGLSLIWP